MGDGQLQLVPAVAAPGITTLGIKAPGQGLAGGLTGPRRIMQRHFADPVAQDAVAGASHRPVGLVAKRAHLLSRPRGFAAVQTSNAVCRERVCQYGYVTGVAGS